MNYTVKAFITLLAVVFLLITAFPVIAQDDDIELPQTYTGDSVTFNYPEDMQVDSVGDNLSFGSDRLDFYVVNPILAEAIDFDTTLSLGDSIAFMLELLNSYLMEDQELYTMDDVESIQLADEREALLLHYMNDTIKAGVFLLVKSSDDLTLGLDMHLESEDETEFTDEDIAIFLAVATTLESSDVMESMEMDEGEDSGMESSDSSGETSELPNAYTMPSGLTFGYPAAWELNSEADTVVVVMTADGRSFIQVHDLGALFGGMEMEMDFMLQTYGNGAATTWGDTEFSTDSFEMTEMGSYEAGIYHFVGVQNDEPATVYVVIVKFDATYYVMVQAYSVGTPPENFEADVMAVAASLVMPE